MKDRQKKRLVRSTRVVPSNASLFGLLLILSTSLMLGACNTTSGAGVQADLADPTDAAVWDALKDGGKVVLFRHGEVQRGRGFGDSRLRDETCARERNLSAAGREQFRRIGEAFAARNIRVDGVMASPFCRTRDSAEVAFGSFEPQEFLSLAEILTETEAQDAAETALDLIGNHDGDGNLILVTHNPNIDRIAQQTVGFAEALVLKPEGGPFFSVIGVLQP